jgi:large subunit ribosomal protein L10
MSKAERQATVEALTSTLQGSPNLYITDFSGLTVEHLTVFRRRLREVGAGYVVVKNTLARRAAAAGQLTALDPALFTGPTGVVLAGDDPLPAAKVITEFAKAHDKPAVKAGLVDGRTVEAAYVRRLGELPSREALLGQFAGALNSILYQLVGALEALREQRQAAAS